VARPGSHAHRPLLAALCVATLSAAGCGGGDDGGSGSPAPVPGTPGAGANAGDEFRTLVLSVCADTTRAVPPVPGPEASRADARAYVTAVRRATITLAADLDRLAAQRPSAGTPLRAIVRRSRAAAAEARATEDGRAGAGGANDLAVAIARLNEAATAAELPQCGL
jgi:hypothetical protein